MSISKPTVTYVPGFILAEEMLLDGFKKEIFQDPKAYYRVLALTDEYDKGEMTEHLSKAIDRSFTVISCPLPAFPKEGADKFLSDIPKVISHLLEHPGNVVVYCKSGVNRSAALAQYLAATGEYELKRPSCTQAPCVDPFWAAFYEDLLKKAA